MASAAEHNIDIISVQEHRYYHCEQDLKYPETGNGWTFVSPLLCYDLLTRPKMPFKVMHRKGVTHSDGSYERKSRGRKLADEMGRAKKNSHGALQSDAPEESDLWTAWVISAWWRLNIRFQRSSGRRTII